MTRRPRRITAALAVLAALLTFGLAACNDSGADTGSNSGSSSE